MATDESPKSKRSMLGTHFGSMGISIPTPAAERPAARRVGGRGRIKEGASMVTFSMRIPRATRDELAALARRSGTSIAALGLEGFAMVAERNGVRLPAD